MDDSVMIVAQSAVEQGIVLDYQKCEAIARRIGTSRIEDADVRRIAYELFAIRPTVPDPELATS